MNINKINNFAHPNFMADNPNNKNSENIRGSKINQAYRQVKSDLNEVLKDSDVEAAKKRILEQKKKGLAPDPGDVALINKNIKDLEFLKKKMDDAVKNAKEEVIYINKSGEVFTKEEAEAQAKKLGKNLDELFKKQEGLQKDKQIKFFKKIYRGFANVIDKVVKKDAAKGLAIALAAGNVLKEVIGGVMYTLQAYTNEDLPEDKRKFVAAYDAIVSVVSASFSALFGFGSISALDKIFEGLLKKDKGHTKYAAATAGLTFFVPNFLQTIIGKRIVAPAVATPVAGKLKDKLVAREEAKKAAMEAKVANA